MVNSNGRWKKCAWINCELILVNFLSNNDWLEQKVEKCVVDEIHRNSSKLIEIRPKALDQSNAMNKVYGS